MQDRTTESESLLVRNLSKGNLLAFNTLYKESVLSGKTISKLNKMG